MKDFYYILGLNQNSTLDQIKEAYRKLSKKFHPDLNQGDKYFESQFREIKDAYEILSDPIKRGQYDAALKKSESSAGEPGKQQYYREQYKHSTSQTSPSGFTRSRRKGPGIGMGVTLILLALILGVYAVDSFSGSKAKKTLAPLYASVPVASKSHKHHKKKFSLKNKTTSTLFKPKPDSIVPKPIHRDFANIKQPATVVSKQPLAIDTKKPDNSDDFLYATYVRPNVTGVVYMRKSGNFNSEVIKMIPANSAVFVLAKGDTYYKVSFNNNMGYVPKWSLQTK